MKAMVMGARIVRTEANPTVKTARKSSNWTDGWSKAIEAEFKLLHNLDSYDQVRLCDVPAGVQIIASKMDLKTKYYSSGEALKLKARLVARGDTEWEKFDQDYYSPTVDDSKHRRHIGKGALLGPAAPRGRRLLRGFSRSHPSCSGPYILLKDNWHTDCTLTLYLYLVIY
jgi:hypothetical protein